MVLTEGGMTLWTRPATALSRLRKRRIPMDPSSLLAAWSRQDGESVDVRCGCDACLDWTGLRYSCPRLAKRVKRGKWVCGGRRRGARFSVDTIVEHRENWRERLRRHGVSRKH